MLKLENVLLLSKRGFNALSASVPLILPFNFSHQIKSYIKYSHINILFLEIINPSSQKPTIISHKLLHSNYSVFENEINKS